MKSDYLWLLAQLERGLPVQKELVDWACSAMLDGLDSPSLVLLAGRLGVDLVEIPEREEVSVND